MDTRPIAFEADMPLATWQQVNLNDEGIAFGYPDTGPNPLLLPETGNQLVRRVNEKYGVDANYGGHAEDRSFLWRRHPQMNPFVKQHLGTDYNVPAGVRVAAPHAFKVAKVWRDPNQDDGWGGQVIGQLEREYRGAGYVIFGHLQHSSLPRQGDHIARGKVFGVVGQPHENGGWYEHLHVQMVRTRLYRYFPVTEAIDGYGRNGTDISADYPDAAPWMSGLSE